MFGRSEHFFEKNSRMCVLFCNFAIIKRREIGREPPKLRPSSAVAPLWWGVGEGERVEREGSLSAARRYLSWQFFDILVQWYDNNNPCSLLQQTLQDWKKKSEIIIGQCFMIIKFLEHLWRNFFQSKAEPAQRGELLVLSIHNSLFTIHHSPFTIHHSQFTIHNFLDVCKKKMYLCILK